MIPTPADHWRILVVDDDKSMRTFLRALLEKKSHTVVDAESAAKAYEQLEECGFSGFDMVLSDYWMPGENGMELLKRISDRDPTLSVVLLTADEERTILENLIRNGGCDYLRKPLDVKALEKSIQLACKKTQQLRSLQSTAQEASHLGQSQRALLERHLSLAWQGVEFYFTSQSQASGDFVSAIDVNKNERYILASDSSGHDLSSAFQSSYFHGLARGMFYKGATMSEMLELSNELILKEWNSDSSTGRSLALCSLKLDLSSNQLSYINAGFPRPMASDANGFAEPIGDLIGAPPLGWFSEKYYECVGSFPEGYLYLWTDGLSDLAEDQGIDALALAHCLLDKGRKDHPWLIQAQDDIAVLRLNPTENSAAHFPIASVNIPGNADKDIDSWQAYFEKSLRAVIPDTAANLLPDILVCLREALINAFLHGCNSQADKTATVQIAMDKNANWIAVHVSDPGTGHSFDTDTHSEKAADELITEHRGMIMMQSIPNQFETLRNGATVKMRFDLADETNWMN